MLCHQRPFPFALEAVLLELPKPELGTRFGEVVLKACQGVPIDLLAGRRAPLGFPVGEVVLKTFQGVPVPRDPRAGRRARSWCWVHFGGTCEIPGQGLGVRVRRLMIGGVPISRRPQLSSVRFGTQNQSNTDLPTRFLISLAPLSHVFVDGKRDVRQKESETPQLTG